jgi:hypothetical protein
MVSINLRNPKFNGFCYFYQMSVGEKNRVGPREEKRNRLMFVLLQKQPSDRRTVVFMALFVISTRKYVHTSRIFGRNGLPFFQLPTIHGIFWVIQRAFESLFEGLVEDQAGLYLGHIRLYLGY